MKVKGCIRRTVAGLMIGLTLFGGYSATYMQARECEAASMYTALYSLFEYMMASCGLAVTNKADNEVLCDAFCDWFENFGLYRSDAQDKLKYDSILAEFNALKTLVAGRKIVLSEYENLKNAMVEFINRYVKSSSANVSATKDLNVFVDSYTTSSSGTKYLVPSAGLLKKYGYSPTYAELYNGSSIRKGHLLSYYHKSKGAFTYNEKPYSGEIFVSYYLAYNNLNYDYKKFHPHSNDYYLTDDFVVHSFVTPSTSVALRAEIFVCDSDEKKIKDVISGLYATDVPLSLQKISDTSVTIFDSAIPNENQSTFATINSAIGMVAGIYGNVDAISSTIGNITELIAGTTPLIDSIAQSIADMDGKTLTADDINEIVSDRIDAIDEIINSVQDDTEDIEQNTATTNSWLSRIYNKIDAISKSVSGSSALQLDDVTDQFKVVNGGGQPDNDDNEPPKIWGVGAFTTIKLLEPVFKFFGEPLSLITKWLNSIQKAIEKASANEVEQAVKNQQENSNAITNVIEVISDFPMKIFEQFKVTLGNIIIYLDNIATAAAAGVQVLTEFPLEIVQWISQGVSEALELHPLEVTIPDVKVDVDFPPIEIPILSDILNVLEAILEAVRAFFIIDTAELEKAMDLNKGKIEKKLPFEPARELFAAFKFSDSYDYPILKIQSPGIIKQFTQDDYIILFNGEDFADYFKFVRGLLVGFFWIGYAYCIVCKFRVRFTLD